MTPLIETKKLTHIYSAGTPFEHVAVKDVDFRASRGEFIGIIGHTGSGKSTLMQMMNGLLQPTSGKVLLDGKDIWEKGTDRRAVRFQVGLVFQYPEYQLFEETVYKDIAFGPKNMGLDEKEIDLKIPSGTANGKIFRVKSEGVPAGNGRKGDLYIKVLIQVPSKLTPAQKKLMEAYAAEEKPTTKPNLIKLQDLSR